MRLYAAFAAGQPGSTTVAQANFRTLQIDTDNYIPHTRVLSRGLGEFLFIFFFLWAHGGQGVSTFTYSEVVPFT